MNKGQEFDTFKLLIAAVVAIAILGILLGILSNMPNLTANPTNTIKTALSDAYQSAPIPSMSPSKAAFKKNINFPVIDQFSNAVGGNSITFSCSAYLMPDSCAGGAILVIKRDFQAYVSACCSTAGPCKVIVGNETANCQ